MHDMAVAHARCDLAQLVEHGHEVFGDRAVPTFTTAKVEKVEKVEQTHQLDISAVGGSSGSPVFDLEGRVIGVTTRKLEGSHVELIPARAVRELIERLGITQTS